MLGSLYITDVHDATQSEYELAFSNVTSIQGSVVISNVGGMVSLGFLHRLTRVGTIHITDAVDLVDSALPSLREVDDVVYVRCPRLCHARRYGAQPGLPENECTKIRLSLYAKITFSDSAELTPAVTSLRPVIRSRLREYCSESVRDGWVGCSV